MDSVVKYFEEEKFQCIIGAIISVVCIAVSIYFLYTQHPVLKGTAYSMLPLSLFLLIICVGIVARTAKDIERVTTFYQEEPAKMTSEELPRMEKVMKTFGIIKKIEMGLFFLSIIAAFIFRNNDVLRGVALGVVVLSVILYLFDHIAESRGESYKEFLKQLTSP